MATGVLVQHSPNARTGQRARRCILTLALLLFLATSHAAPQSNSSTCRPSTPAPPWKSPPPFLEAETLLRQGSVDEAKKKIQEQLALNPSVEGYNLLGIVYSSQKDYANALEAFQRALKIDPNSSKTCNNLGNLYVAQERLDLAEKEFR